jgi:hypothetical protein
MNDFATRNPDKVLVLAAAAFLLGGCLSIGEPREPLLWEGPFAPTAGATRTITGSAFMAAMEQRTDAAIGVIGDPGVQLAWIIRNGACSGTGNAVAPATVFPNLVTTLDGVGESEARINRRIEQGTYSVEVFADSQAGERLACADLLPRS